MSYLYNYIYINYVLHSYVGATLGTEYMYIIRIIIINILDNAYLLFWHDIIIILIV